MKDQPVNRGGIYARYFLKPQAERPAVTKPLHESVTKLEKTVTKVGRPKRHATAADRARAYRERKKHGQTDS